MARTNKTVPLGSGRCYVAEFTAESMPAAADLVALCKDENLLGETINGGTFSYSAEKHEEKDDHGVLMRIDTIEETAKLGLGVFSWCNDTLTKLISTARVEADGQYQVLKIGGLDKDNGKLYTVIFKHDDKKNGNLYIALVGTNTADISLAFAKDSTTKLSPEFTAQPSDAEGTLAYMFEDLPSAG